MEEEKDTKTTDEILDEAEEEIEVMEEPEEKEEKIEEKKEEKETNETKIIVEEKKKRSVFSIIFSIIVTILIIVVIFETVMGVLDMQRINDEKEPYWYIDQKTEEKDGKKITKYNIGLYKIVKAVSDTETKIELKPFFLQ